MAEKKEKPKYNLIQNTAYAFKNIWESGQKMLAIAAIARIPISLILTIIALYTPKIILDRLEFSETVQQGLAAIAALLAAAMCFELANNYIGAKKAMMEHRMLFYFSKLNFQKNLDTDYENLEKPNFLDIHKKAGQGTGNNHTAAMQLPNNFANLLVNMLSFVFFAGVISFLNPLILLLLCLCVLINYFMLKAVKNYEHKIKDRRASLARGSLYCIFRQSGSFPAGFRELSTHGSMYTRQTCNFATCGNFTITQTAQTEARG